MGSAISPTTEEGEVIVSSSIEGAGAGAGAGAGGMDAVCAAFVLRGSTKDAHVSVMKEGEEMEVEIKRKKTINETFD